MRRVIEIDADDMDALKSTVMTVDEMYNTLQGRIYCAVAGSKDIQVIDVREYPGEWKEHKEENCFGEFRNVGFKCSKCGKIVTTSGYRYCPHCGARMV